MSNNLKYYISATVFLLSSLIIVNILASIMQFSDKYGFGGGLTIIAVNFAVVATSGVSMYYYRELRKQPSAEADKMSAYGTMGQQLLDEQEAHDSTNTKK